MRLGTAIHNFLDAYYGHFVGASPVPIDQATLFDIFEKAQEKVGPAYEDQLCAIRAMTILSRYVEYSIQHDDFTVLATEQEFFVFLGFEINGRPVFAHVIIDLVVEEFANTITIIDHKSGAKFWTESQVYYDAQIPYYMDVLDRAGLHVNKGVINCINNYEYKKPHDVPLEKMFARVEAYHDEERLKRYRQYVVDKIKMMYELPPWKNLTKQCTFCTFHDICNAEIRGIPTAGMIANFGQSLELTMDLGELDGFESD